MEKPGSTTKPGYLYHSPAFPVEGYKVCRGNNRQRLDVLLANLDWRHRNVLDVGCSVGYFTIKLAMAGARTLGIDTDADAIAFARKQALEYGIERCTFNQPDNRYFKDKDVLLALSVLPWIYATVKNPADYIHRLFQIQTAFIEIPYPPDGRANVPGVNDDESAQKYLEKYYEIVEKIAVLTDDTEGIKRPRTIWKCEHPPKKNAPKITYGSQANVEFTGESVIKAQRNGKTYSATREYDFLRIMSPSGVSPKPLLGPSKMDDSIEMSYIEGQPLTACTIEPEKLEAHFGYIAAELEARSVCHNDIRPDNIIVGGDGVYLVDYGHATMQGEVKPQHVNPVYSAKTDRDSFDLILRQYARWYNARNV